MSTASYRPSDSDPEPASPRSLAVDAQEAGTSATPAGEQLNTVAYTKTGPGAEGIQNPLPCQIAQRYTLRSVLGQGTFGCVYSAWDEVLQRRVAIKRARRERFDSLTSQTQFLNEARAVAKLKHPHIVAVYDSGIDDTGSPFVVFELIDGESLATRQQRLPLSRDQSVELVACVAEAVHAAHRAGLIHRDLKPANILLDRAGRPYITDFGLAVDEHTQRDQAGTIAGTMSYMSPEQWRGETHYMDGRTDIWSLGVIFYELLVGRRPFTGSEIHQLRDEVLYRQPKPLRQIDDTIPHELERTCLKCLGKSSVDRFTTAADIASALRSPQAPRSRLLARAIMIGLALTAVAVLAVFSMRGPTVVPPLPAPVGGVPVETVAAVATENQKRTAAEISTLPSDPLGWRSRLGMDPVELFWPGHHGTGLLAFRPELQAFEVNSDSIRLVKLGELSVASARLSVSFQQSIWLGGPGLFLGYRESVVNGRLCARMQLIRLTDTIQPGGHHVFQIQRTRTIIYPQTGGLIHEREWALQQVLAPAPGQSPRLSVAFSDGTFQSIQWNGDDLTSLLHADDCTEDDFKGSWGLFHQNGSTWFRNPDHQELKD